MFKIKYLGEGCYSVRSMLDNSMGWTNVSGKLVMTTIGTSDSAIPENAKWKINSNSNGYYFVSMASSSSMVVTSPDTNRGNILLSQYSNSNSKQNWTIKPITASYHGVTLKNKTNKMLNGTTFQFSAVAYSTYNNFTGNDGFTWSVTNGTGQATINSRTGVLTANSVGTVTVNVKYATQNWTADCLVHIIPIEEGDYYFKNAETSKYMQPDDNGDLHMEQHEFDSTLNQRWHLRFYNESYYYIINNETNKYLTAPNNSTDGSSILESDYDQATQSRQLWSISKIPGRTTYKIQSKNQINSNFVLAVGWGANWNGINIEQRSFSSDSNYKDEWNLFPLYVHTVNLDVIYDNAYNNRYNNANSRINKQILALQEKYLTEFGITVNKKSFSMFSSYADTNCTTSYNTKCNHAQNSSCKDSILYVDGTTKLETYHHTNIYNIVLRIPFPNLSDSVKVAYIGHDYCTEDNHSDKPYNGFAYESIGLAAIMNFSSEKSETKTFIHEFGHLYGIDDHYVGSAKSTNQMISETGNAGFSKNCIYGENKEDAVVLNNYTICDGCKSVIEKNINRYKHK